MERRKSQLADGKGFNSWTSRQEPLKSACFATKMLPKHVLPICYQTDLGRGLTAGDSPFLKSIMATATSFAWRADVHIVTNPEHRFFARSILAMVVVSDARQAKFARTLWRFKNTPWTSKREAANQRWKLFERPASIS
jgi:hypothetical protein